MPRDGADHHDLRGVCQGNRCGRESAEYIDDLRTPRAFSRPLASRARSHAPSSALGSQRTLRWRKPDSSPRSPAMARSVGRRVTRCQAAYEGTGSGATADRAFSARREGESPSGWSRKLCHRCTATMCICGSWQAGPDGHQANVRLGSISRVSMDFLATARFRRMRSGRRSSPLLAEERSACPSRKNRVLGQN